MKKQRPHNFTHLQKICESAAKKIDYPKVIKHLHESLPEEYWSLAESTVIYFLPRAILDLETKMERRAALKTIPNDIKPSNLRLLIEEGIMILWEKEKDDFQKRPSAR